MHMDMHKVLLPSGNKKAKFNQYIYMYMYSW